MVRAAWRRISAYFDNDDPRLAVGATVAFIVAGNQPFYPAYVWYVAGAVVWPALLTWLSAPFFLAAPALMRRYPDAGRVLLLATALGNTLVSVKALGTASGVELFYIPCIALGGLMATPPKRRATVLGTALVSLASLALARIDGEPLAPLSAAQSHGLASMHAISVGCLCFVLAIMAFRLWRAGTKPVSRSA